MKTAQIGYGYWGKNLLRVLCSLKGANQVVCCEPDKNAQERLRENFPEPEITDNFPRLVQRQDIDSVVIATPAGLHFEQAKKALEAGKHLLVEKPMALAASQAAELNSIAEKQKRILMVGHTFLYNDAVRYIKGLIDKGELGEIYYMYFQRLNLGRVRDDVNALWNLAPHDVSIAQYWMGEKPEKIMAHGVSQLQKGIDDANFVNLYYPSGRFVHIHVSWLSPFKIRQAVVIGSKKMAFYNDTSPDQKVVIHDKGIDRKDMYNDLVSVPYKSFAQFTFIQRAGDILIPKISFREPLRVEMEHFLECIKTGATPLTNGHHGLEVVEILEAAQKSCESEI